jgi:hypothetical protein
MLFHDLNHRYVMFNSRQGNPIMFKGQRYQGKRLLPEEWEVCVLWEEDAGKAKNIRNSYTLTFQFSAKVTLSRLTVL